MENIKLDFCPDYQDDARVEDELQNYVDNNDIKNMIEMYSMSVSKFMQLAKDAKACYKVNQLVLVNLDIIDEYLETFHIVDDEFYK